ncbi:S-adenosylmethionine:tRNA ribosyltransferase-isomerase [Streptomyces sp. LN785]|uniref:S-adenosylmethionine:tRNA ribosyltransferase-isomerase n=1 Tax=Streptomyces sp. LN785 TaxID=3112983 RepID=UPI00370FB972
MSDGGTGGRAIAFGTTAVRAVGPAVDADGTARATTTGWTGRERTARPGVRVVDGLPAGPHGPEASRPPMPEAVAERAAAPRGYPEALRHQRLRRESRDVHLSLL